MSIRCRVLLLSLLVLGLNVESSPAAGKRYALVVGVRTYRPGQPLPELSYTENDADGLAKVLRAGGYDVTLMTQAVGRTRGNEVLTPQSSYIRDQLDVVLDNPFLKPEDVVVVALAGHGVQYEFAEGTSRTPRFYFCPADADIREIATANQVTERNRLLDLGEVYAALRECRAGGKLLLVDACRNDPSQPAVTRAVASRTLPPLPPPPGGTAAFFSCSANQRAYEDKDLGGGHGVFFHHVIQALGGAADSSTPTRPADGEITLTELSEHVAAGTYDHVARKYRAKQAPELKGEFRLAIPLIELRRDVLAGTRAGEARIVGGDLAIDVRWCPPGIFTMGSPARETGRDDDETQVRVTLANGFWMGRTEVTQKLWQDVMASRPWLDVENADLHRRGETYPAVFVDWDAATDFCRRLTQRERTAGRLPSEWAFRLPTEAEWEYACRAGTGSPHSFGTDESQLGEYGWFFGNSSTVDELWAHEVGLKKPNPWGLHDVHGNVWEWCSDRYETRLAGGADPVGPSRGATRVLRGGSWLGDAESCRSAARLGSDPASNANYVGFRLVLGRSTE